MGVVSDSSPLILLSAIGELNLLQSLYSIINVPDAVYEEITAAGAGLPGAQEISDAGWIHRHKVRNKRAVTKLMKATGLDRGESEAIILAQELGASLLIVDDGTARRYAKKKGMPITGAIGVLLAAKNNGLIQAVKPLLGELIAAGIWLDAETYQNALKIAGE